MENFDEHLNKELSKYKRLARSNYLTAYFIALIAIISSFFTSLSVIAEWFKPICITILAAIPGLVLLMNNTFNFDVKSRWCWRKYYRLQSLLFAFKYENKPIEQITKELTDLHLDMDKEWPKTGKFSPLSAEQNKK